MSPKYPGKSTVINGNGAVAAVMNQVCGGVIGYPITPSTEISETFQAALAQGKLNVWGKTPFFFEPEGEHSAQSGAMGAALTGGKYISNASSSQGVLYALESHYVTVGKRAGGFVLQVASRVVSRHSLNVMGGHDDVYSLLPAGYTIFFGATPEEAADLALISFRTSALSLIPVANCMDGFSTSHMLSEARLPEDDLVREYLGDPTCRIKCPTVAQEILYGDAQGMRQLVPSLVDTDNPGMSGAVQNQPDFQSGVADSRTHFAADVPRLARRAMDEYNALTGREYAPVRTNMCEDAEVILVGLGSITQDVQAVLPHLRRQGIKVGLVQILQLAPFPEADFVRAIGEVRHIAVLERSDMAALTDLVNVALWKAAQNQAARTPQTTLEPRLPHPDIPALTGPLPTTSSAFFGIGGHDVQPRHLIALAKTLNDGDLAPEVYLGTTFFDDSARGEMRELQERLRAAYPETQRMQLRLEENPADLLPPDAIRLRFHSVGGYGTIATGKLLTDILAEMLQMRSKAAPKYGSEKSGAPTNYYITLSPEPVLITNAALEDCEVVISPDHMVFMHDNPLRGLVRGGTFIVQSNLEPKVFWASLPRRARDIIREKQINLFILDAFKVAEDRAPNPDLRTRMMGVAFIGAVATKVDRIAKGANEAAMLEKIREQITKKFGSKGAAVVEANMEVVRDGAALARRVDYETLSDEDLCRAPLPPLNPALSAQMCSRAPLPTPTAPATNATPTAPISRLFDPEYFRQTMGEAFFEGTISESPVYPGSGFFLPAASAGQKNKGLFRRQVPSFDASLCTGCMECTLVCPDAAIPNTVFSIDTLLDTAWHQALDAALCSAPLPVGDRVEDGVSAGACKVLVSGGKEATVAQQLHAIGEAMRAQLLELKTRPAISQVFRDAVEQLGEQVGLDQATIEGIARVLDEYPVSRTRPFFDQTEKKRPGQGALFSVTIDPWKCTGCLECISVCGPEALVETVQDDEVLARTEQRFAFLTKLPNTPAIFSDPNAGPSTDLKRIFLDHDNYYSTIGGHGACKGCGEVTAIRQTMALANYLHHTRNTQRIAQLEDLVTQLQELRRNTDLDPETFALAKTVTETLDAAKKRWSGAENGRVPAGTVVANATGCSSVYASTAPYNSYQDPWVNGLFQDAQPLAKGIFEGLAADRAGEVLAGRQARELLAGRRAGQIESSEPNWTQWSPQEMQLLPNVMTIGGDGASYDIGFGAMSRILASHTPIKMLVLNTGAYSNTGGQASTASLEGQDSDLARYGSALKGKSEERKELGLLAAMHPKTMVVATSTSYQAHFLKNVAAALEQSDYPAVIDVYTPCQPEHGIAEDAAAEHSRQAVKSRVSPMFVHWPERDQVPDRFDLAGNPNPRDLWSKYKLAYTDAEGQAKLMELPYTPADFALSEMRFVKHFAPLPESAPGPLPLAEFVELGAEEREGHTPFIYAAPGGGSLVRMLVSPSMVLLTQQCRDYWRLLQYLAGQELDQLRKDNARLDKELAAALEAAGVAEAAEAEEAAAPGAAKS